MCKRTRSFSGTDCQRAPQKAPNVGAGASGIWEHREETQRPLHETMRLAEAWPMWHAPGGSMPSQILKYCKIQSRKGAPKMAILEAPCAQNAPGRSTMRLPEAPWSSFPWCFDFPWSFLTEEIPWCFECFQQFFSVFLGVFWGSEGVKNPWCFGRFSLVFT